MDPSSPQTITPSAPSGPAAPPSPAPMAVTPAQPPAPKHVKHAHRFLQYYIFILLIALVAGGIYAWQNNKVKSLNTKLGTSNAKVASLTKQLNDTEASLPSDSNAGNAPNNPYAGWKTYCDNFSSTCLRYPKDWTLAGSTSPNKTSATFTNAKDTAVVSYDNPYPVDQQEQVYYIADIQDLTIKNLGPRIVGRTLGSTPTYVLVDGTYLSTNHMVVGQSFSFQNNATFTTNVPKVTARLMAAPSAAALTGIKNSDQAAAWFKTDDAKTGLKILESLYYQ